MINTIPEIADFIWKYYHPDLQDVSRLQPDYIDIKEDLLAIQRIAGEIKLEGDSTCPSLTIQDQERIILQGLDFGHFDIIIIFSLDYPEADIKAQDPIFAGRYFHPHVNQIGNLCLGDGRTAYSNAIKQKRIFDAYEVVKQILKTYSPSNPYIRIASWHSERHLCSECEESFTGRDIKRCRSCQNWVCSACSFSCYKCERIRCPKCTIFVQMRSVRGSYWNKFCRTHGNKIGARRVIKRLNYGQAIIEGATCAISTAETA